MKCTLLVALMSATSAALAQNPTPALGHTGALSGIVRDVRGTPLAGVTVSLLGETAQTRSDLAGYFKLSDIAPGNHTALFRRLGYRSIDYRWVAKTGGELQISVAMTPIPVVLNPVVTEVSGASRRRGTSSIGGTVSDSSGHAVDSADVRLLGAGLSTMTDSTGRFRFESLAAGAYIVRARRLGLTAATYVMQIADDDARSISLKMYGVSKHTRDSASASGFGAVDAGFDAFDRRERGASRGPLLGPGDLFRTDRAPLDIVLQQYRDALVPSRRRISADTAFASGGDCLLIDGRRPLFQPLRSFTSVDVQLVEIFRANAFVDPFLVAQMDALRECRGDDMRHPGYFVLWTRALR